jgi:hypothetical protein
MPTPPAEAAPPLFDRDTTSAFDSTASSNPFSGVPG